MTRASLATRAGRAVRSFDWRKLLVIVAAVLVVWEIAYVAAVNAMLRTGTLEKLINSGTPDAQVQLTNGWSIWPGRVHLDRVQVRFQDRNLQFRVIVENAVVDIALLELPTKTIHLERVRGDNVSYVFRHKVESPKGLEKRLAHYPKIEGFADPPVFTEARKPPLGDDEYDLWTIHLEDTDVQVRELWFLEYRFVGRGRATGGFRLEPQRDAQTYPCRLELEGTLNGGPHVVAHDFRGTIDAKLQRHDPREVQGEKIFEKISLRLDLRGEVPNLAVTDLYAGPSLAVTRGAGQLRLQTDFREGNWSEGSKVRYTTDAVTVRSDAMTVSGAAELEARITRGGEDSRVELSADVPRASVHSKGGAAAVESPSLRRVRAALGATANIARPPLRWTSLSAELRASAPDLRWFNHVLEKPDLFRGGNAELNAKLDWAEDKLGTGNLELDAEKVAFVLVEQPVEISGKLVATGSYDANTKRGTAKKLTLELPGVGVASKKVPGGLHVRSERLQWRDLPPEQFDGQFELTGETIKPLVPLVISSDILRALAEMLVSLGKTRAVATVQRTPAAWELKLEEAKSGDVEAFGQLRGDAGVPHPCGRWYVQDGSLSVGVVQAAGETTVEPLVSASWWRERPAGARCTAATSEKSRPPVRLSARAK